jgi:hypothetical protein
MMATITVMIDVRYSSRQLPLQSEFVTISLTTIHFSSRSAWSNHVLIYRDAFLYQYCLL